MQTSVRGSKIPEMLRTSFGPLITCNTQRCQTSNRHYTHHRRRFSRVDVVPLEAGGEVVGRGLPGVVEHLAGVGRGHVGDDAALAQRHRLAVAAAATVVPDQLKLLFCYFQFMIGYQVVNTVSSSDI